MGLKYELVLLFSERLRSHDWESVRGWENVMIRGLYYYSTLGVRQSSQNAKLSNVGEFLNESWMLREGLNGNSRPQDCEMQKTRQSHRHGYSEKPSSIEDKNVKKAFHQ